MILGNASTGNVGSVGFSKGIGVSHLISAGLLYSSGFV
jgi:hypothetical protein